MKASGKRHRQDQAAKPAVPLGPVQTSLQQCSFGWLAAAAVFGTWETLWDALVTNGALASNSTWLACTVFAKRRVAAGMHCITPISHLQSG